MSDKHIILIDKDTVELVEKFNKVLEPIIKTELEKGNFNIAMMVYCASMSAEETTLRLNREMNNRKDNTDDRDTEKDKDYKQSSFK